MTQGSVKHSKDGTTHIRYKANLSYQGHKVHLNIISEAFVSPPKKSNETIPMFCKRHRLLSLIREQWKQLFSLYEFFTDLRGWLAQINSPPYILP